MRLPIPLLALSLALAGAASAQAIDPRQAPTESEKAACEPDAVRLCSSTYPDADKMLDCMKANKTALTPTCRKAFEEGLKRRGL